MLLTYENTAASYPGTTPASWTSGYPAGDFANVIYNQPTSAGMAADLALAANENVGYIYVTDGQLSNPYGQLPSYWDQEVASLQARRRRQCLNRVDGFYCLRDSFPTQPHSLFDDEKRTV